ncbi:MAG: branched-chain amino acid transaminase [Candidatus Micrarchaeota archaeon]|nr:branched-chain amino acid transaminase [Candidatus Micrarchaeota archaeon]
MVPAHKYVWYNGSFKKFDDVKVHVFTHTLQYGNGVFEGIRSYPTANGKVAVFRLREHIDRFLNGAKVLHMRIPFTRQQLMDAVADTVKKNNAKHSYIRPLAYYETFGISLHVADEKPSVSITTMEFGEYIKGKERGLRCMVSSWRKVDSSMLTPLVKATGNYLSSVLALSDAKAAGYDEVILLSEDGHVDEGSGENIFLVENGKLVTPAKDANMLFGITRDSIIKIAESIGLEVEQRPVHREELVMADEVFLTGTAAEVTPVVSINGTGVGNGKIGPITKMVNDRYMRIVTGQDEEFKHWLTYV